MNSNKKFLPTINVGGKKIVKKSNISYKVNLKLKEILDKNKSTFMKCNVDELVMEKGLKIHKYKNNIKIIYGPNMEPLGFLVSGFPDIKNKIITEIPSDFQKAVEELNEEDDKEVSELEKALSID